MTTDNALKEARGGFPIVFVDDFLGSGAQFIETWERDILGNAPCSFQAAHARAPFRAFCLVLIATHAALDHIRKNAPSVHISAMHVLDDLYSIKQLESPSLSPPIPNFQSAIRAFLERYSSLFQLPPFMRKVDWPSYGFHSLGLLLAFEHGVPDSSIPLIWASAPDPWVQLVKPR